MEIELTKNKVAIIDNSDWSIVKPYNWYATCSKSSNRYYAATKITLPNGKQTSIHMSKLLMNPEKGLIVTYLNGDSLDLRRSNLKVCTWSEIRLRNNNIKKIAKSGCRGVYRRSDDTKWVAKISVNSKIIQLGYFDTIEEAYAARLEAEKKYRAIED
jgi:hypothetical protein